MNPPVSVPGTIIDERVQITEKKEDASDKAHRKVPIRYEEVILTEEAAEILEKAKIAAAERPAGKIGRLPAGDPGDFRR